jgi:hypothetical protein
VFVTRVTYILEVLDTLLTFIDSQHEEKLIMIECSDTILAKLNADRKRIRMFLGMTNDFQMFGAKDGMWEKARRSAFDGVDVEVGDLGKDVMIKRAETMRDIMKNLVLEVSAEVGRIVEGAGL